jgi:MoaA/NifB/PqqE/SkfB family radical SAM enzyme
MKQNKYSNFKIFNFQDKINSFKKNEITAPIYVRVKPINLCNHGCFFCAYSTGFRIKDGGDHPHVITKMHEDMLEDDVIPYNKMKEILENFSDMGVRAVTYSGGGEPLMYPDIIKTMKETIDRKIDLSIITNGQNLTKERAEVLAESKWVRVSIDYTSGVEIRSFRNISEKSFNSIINNISNFSKIKSKETDLGVNFIVHNKNYKNIYEFAKLLKDIGVENIRFSPMYTPEISLYHEKIEDHVKEQLIKIQNLVDDNFTVNSSYDTKGESHSAIRIYNKCYVMQTVPVIGADLNVYACHNKAYDNSGKIGSIKNQSFKKLWFNDETRQFMMTFNPKHKCLHECANDNKNIIINSYINTSIDNFI